MPPVGPLCGSDLAAIPTFPTIRITSRSSFQCLAMKVLPRNRYGIIKERISSVPFNHYFARSVLERHVTGSVLVDSVDDPRTAYIFHPYGLSLLIGDPFNEEFNHWLKRYILDIERKRVRHEWMQVYPDSWNQKLREILGQRIGPPKDEYDPNIVELHSRVNFQFDREAFTRYLEHAKELPDGYEIVEIDPDLFQRIEGLVIPKSFWDNADDFKRKGIGFCIIKGDEIVSWSYTVWIHGDLNEIGIETSNDYRGKGFSEIASKEFIQYCINHHQTPVWSCRLENQFSYRLALKLGFRETLRIPFYRICEKGSV
jgi:RimJ/RimL family protein N-acetyltransferase